MQDNIDLNDLIDSESYTYSVSNIEDARTSYNPQETVQISFQAGNYMIDCRQVYIACDVNISGTNAQAYGLLARQQEDYFQCSMLEINGVSLLQSNLSSGKNLFCNWLKNSLTPYKKPVQDCSIASILSSQYSPCYNTTINRVLYYDMNSDCQGSQTVTACNLSSVMSYDQSMLQSAQYRQRHYVHSLATDTGVISTVQSTEFNQIYIRLGDICQEFDSLGLVNMCNTQIRMQLRLNDRNLVLTCGFASPVFVNSDLTTTQTYSLSNLFLYYKVLQIKPNLISQAKQLTNQPKQIVTVYQNQKILEGVVTNQRFSVNSSNLYYLILFLQPSLNSKSTAGTAIINYDIDTANSFNNLKFGSYEDSLEFKHSQLVIDISGKKYKQSIIPVSNRGYKSWIDAQNAVYQCTGQHLSIGMNQFLNNRFFAIVPLSPNQFPNTIFTDSTLSVNVLLELDSQDKRYANPSSMMMNTFIIGSKVLLDNCTRIE